MNSPSDSWRPAITLRAEGASDVDWSKTFHVDSAEAFVNGLFGLFAEHTFEAFLAQGGRSAQVGETLLYQVKEQLHLRFEIKKLGPNEFEVRGSHFSTPFGVNICVGKNPTVS
jgi:hypothetical protein